MLGGGLAGIAASARLAEAGWDVTLLEARKSLGGRAFSFPDPGDFRDPDGDEDDIDNGQHVIVGACRNLIDFLSQIGIWDSWRLQPRLDVAIYDRGGRLGRLYGVNLRPPAHLLPAFLTYPHLGLWDKMRAIRGLVATMFARRNDANVENITFYHWLRAHGQSERTIYNLWNVLIEGTLNDNVRDVSAAMGLMIVQDGLLDGRQDANIGYPKVALGDAIGEPARRHLEALGVNLWLGCPVRGINADDENAVSSITIGNRRTLSADAYVSALPFWVLPNLLPRESDRPGTVPQPAHLANIPHRERTPPVRHTRNVTRFLLLRGQPVAVGVQPFPNSGANPRRHQPVSHRVHQCRLGAHRYRPR